MDRAITRRDFLNGVSMTFASSNARTAAGAGGSAGVRVRAGVRLFDYYPPTRVGMRGSHAGSFEVLRLYAGPHHDYLAGLSPAEKKHRRGDAGSASRGRGSAAAPRNAALL